MPIGDRIKEFAVAKYGEYGAQAKLAEALGISRGRLGDYVQERMFPSTQLFEKIGELGVNLDWLITGRGEMIPAFEPNRDISTLFVGEPLPPYRSRKNADELGKAIADLLKQLAEEPGEVE